MKGSFDSDLDSRENTTQKGSFILLPKEEKVEQTQERQQKVVCVFQQEATTQDKSFQLHLASLKSLRWCYSNQLSSYSGYAIELLQISSAALTTDSTWLLLRIFLLYIPDRACATSTWEKVAQKALESVSHRRADIVMPLVLVTP